MQIRQEKDEASWLLEAQEVKIMARHSGLRKARCVRAKMAKGSSKKHARSACHVKHKR